MQQANHASSHVNLFRRTAMNDEPQGYDVPAVEAWIKDNIPHLIPPFQWTRLQGGHSNLTYRLDDIRGNQAVIRRPPMGELLPKAHDMGREWALISALQNTGVPVPEAMGFCESADVTGAWFYVMGCIDGHPLYNSDDTELYVPPACRQVMADSFIDVLANLHAIDPDEAGLGNLGKRDGYVGRQLKTWYRSWTASVEPAEYDDPRAHELQAYFLDKMPEQEPARIVHGDYGLHNTLIGADGQVAAVVDWEISTLGDPLADLGYALNQWSEPEDEFISTPGGATSVAGFPRRQDLAERYAEKTGRDLSMLDYYIAFNRWKSACINHGVYARYMAGQKSTEGVDIDTLRVSVERNLIKAEEATERLERHLSGSPGA
jgi:aminoglycoside phosphotransferase (APT) family kinase protein